MFKPFKKTSSTIQINTTTEINYEIKDGKKDRSKISIPVHPLKPLVTQRATTNVVVVVITATTTDTAITIIVLLIEPT